MTVLPETPARIVSSADLPAAWRGGVVAIGNFDGVHRGHQAVLRAARSEADRLGAPCLMLTFEPHPRSFFSGQPLFRLTTLPLKATAAVALGLDGTLVLDFNADLASWSAEEFVQKMLVDCLGTRAVVTGHDFHFGKARRGTPEFLQGEGDRNGFAVTVVEALREGAHAVSSTRIRAALATGDVAAARTLLGWTWSVVGTVAHGEARGRTLGYPTANMALDPATDLAHGIYAVRYLRPDGGLLEGVASFGRRPTFDNGAPLLETHVFDFNDDLYGERGLVSLVAFIRPELKFDSAEALIAQMDLDSSNARVLLAEADRVEFDLSMRTAWLKLAGHS